MPFYRDDFPALRPNAEGRRTVYLDSAATAQKPERVLQAEDAYYRTKNANPHRGLYELSLAATKAYEDARAKTASFINARDASEIIFVRNATEALNLIAYSWALHNLTEGDEIVLPVSEHHSNLIPWQIAARARGAKLVYMYPDASLMLPEKEIKHKITDKTRLVAIATVSNALGTRNPVEAVIRRAREVGALVVLDAAQSIGHMPLDVQALDADFAVFSGHKMMAPMGIGVLYGKQKLLDAMPPFQTGGEMIEYVTEQDATFAPLPQKFEAGTPNVGGAVGLAAAIDYIGEVGYNRIAQEENRLIEYALRRLRELPHVQVYGAPSLPRCGVISFNVEGVHPHDVASILDGDGIAIRAGHHCAQPLMRHLGIQSTCRASFYFYNTLQDIDRLCESLLGVRRWLGLEP